MKITYRLSEKLDMDEVISLYKKAEMPRPTDDKSRMEQMLNNSHLIITARYQKKLVGICRCITDWVWCCYLSDLVVDPHFKNSGIGKQLIKLVQDKLGRHCMILLLSVPTAMEYYPKIGFQKEERAFMIPRYE